MVGKNTMKLNQATMLEALQEYFDKRYTPGEGRKIKVMSVGLAPGSSYSSNSGGSGDFEVMLDAETAPVPGKSSE